MGAAKEQWARQFDNSERRDTPLECGRVWIHIRQTLWDGSHDHDDWLVGEGDRKCSECPLKDKCEGYRRC